MVRVWLPDRPGALGQVASRIGAVGGDVVGIDILERGAGRAIDELVVLLPSAELVGLLSHEIDQVDGVDIEEVVPATATRHDPSVDALAAAVALVEHAGDAGGLSGLLCAHVVGLTGGTWAALLHGDPAAVVGDHGEVPSQLWLQAYVHGSRSSAPVARGEAGPTDLLSVELEGAGATLVVGRLRGEFHHRDREQSEALARIVDVRLVATGWEPHRGGAPG